MNLLLVCGQSYYVQDRVRNQLMIIWINFTIFFFAFYSQGNLITHISNYFERWKKKNTMAASTWEINMTYTTYPHLVCLPLVIYTFLQRQVIMYSKFHNYNVYINFIYGSWLCIKTHTSMCQTFVLTLMVKRYQTFKVEFQTNLGTLFLKLLSLNIPYDTLILFLKANIQLNFYQSHKGIHYPLKNFTNKG